MWPVRAHFITNVLVWLSARSQDGPVNWGDVPTWVTAGVAFLALVGAATVYRYQAEQVRLQREQLEDQKAATIEQSRVVAEQNRLRQREQAELVELSHRPAEPPRAGGAYDKVWMAVVENRSHRPIRNVVCRIWPTPNVVGGPYVFEAQAVAPLVPTSMPPNTEIFSEPVAGGQVPVIPGGRKYGFKFEVSADRQNAEFRVRFADDSDLLWEIDNDLHPKRLEPRDW